MLCPVNNSPNFHCPCPLVLPPQQVLPLLPAWALLHLVLVQFPQFDHYRGFVHYQLACPLGRMVHQIVLAHHLQDYLNDCVTSPLTFL